MSKLKTSGRVIPFKRSTVPSLDHSLVDLKLLRKQIKDEMTIILRQGAPEKHAAKIEKSVILDLALMEIINCIFEPEEFTEMGVKHIFTSSQKYVQSESCLNYFFFVRTHSISTFHEICRQIRMMKGNFTTRINSQKAKSKKSENKSKDKNYSFMKDTNDFLKAEKENEKKRIIKIFVYCIPRKTKLTEFQFERNGLLCRIEKIGSFGLDLIPLDKNLVTLSIPRSFYQIEYLKNTDVCYQVARGILKFESIYGRILRKKWIGLNSKVTLNIYNQLDKDLSKFERDYSLSDDEDSSDLDLSELSESSENEEETEGEAASKKNKLKNKNMYRKKYEKCCEISELLVIDRSVDLLTPLLTPLTYEALINMIFGIKENGIFDYTQVKTFERVSEKSENQKFQKDSLNLKIIEQQQQQLRRKNHKYNTRKNNSSSSSEKQNQNQINSEIKNIQKKEELEKKNIQKRTVTKLILNEDDDIFSKIRSKSINHIAPFLQKIVMECKEFENRENYNNIEKIKSFMLKIPKYTDKKNRLACHIAISSQIKESYNELRKKVDMERSILLNEKNKKNILEYIEDLIITKEKCSKVLNFLVLFNLMNFGIYENVFLRIQNELIQSYGIQVLLTLKVLRDSKLIKIVKKNESKNFSDQLNYQVLRKKLNLFTEEEKELIKNIHYVFTGYGAMSCKFILEYFIKNNEKLFCLLHHQFSIHSNLFKKKNFKSSNNNNNNTNSNNTNNFEFNYIQKNKKKKKKDDISKQMVKKVLVFFVGGVSRAEICTLRHLENIFGNRIKFLICTTEVFVDFLDQFTKL